MPSTPLAHTDFSGFFPFNISRKQDWDANQLGLYTAVFEIPLQLLVKPYWRAKSFDWSCNLGYSVSTPEPGGGSDPTTDIGTASGSGTVNNLPGGGAPFTFTPQQRAVPRNAPVGVDDFGDEYVSFNVTSNGTRRALGASTNYSTAIPFYFNWNQFVSFTPPPNPAGYVARDFSVEPAVYYTSLGLSGGGGSVGISTSSINGTVFPLALTIDGVAIPTSRIPFELSLPLPTSTGSITGEIAINFNNFWD